MNIEILDENRKLVIISEIDDLTNLPDLSIMILINNQNCMQVIRTYALLDFYFVLENKNQPQATKEMCFDLCTQELLDGPRLGLSKELAFGYDCALMRICGKISGILSTTPYLDPVRFVKDQVKIMKHNYGETTASLR